MLSYDSGDTTAPLLDETIGQNLARTATTYPEREALVDCATGRRWTYSDFHAATRRIACALLERGIGAATGSASGRRTAPSGRRSSTPPRGSARSSSTSIPPTEPRARVRAEPVVESAADRSRRRSRRATTPRWSTRSAAECAGLREVVNWLRGRGSTVWRAPPVDDGALATRRGAAASDDPINIQYTSGTTGLPEGRDAVAPQHPQQRVLRRRALGYTERDRVCMPVPFYHCFGMVMGNLACTSHGAAMVVPGAGASTPRRRWRRSRPSAARRSTACRRCSSRSSSIPTSTDFDLSSLRTGIMAGVALPGRSDEAGHRPDAHGRGHHLLRHDRDVAGLDPDRGRRHRRAARRHRRPRACRTSRCKIVDPAPGRPSPRGVAGRAVHPRLLA